MKFSEQWLREWINPDLTTEELCHKLTVAGLEVDSVEPVAADFTNVVVAQVVKAQKHPNADKLHLCEVTTGNNDKLSVVCGGANVREGMKVALAKVGALLPGDFKIKKSKLRGELSEGMLCATTEIGLGECPDKHIMDLPEDAPLGTDLREYLQLDDNTIDIELTPNRGDCLGILGLAREVGAITNAQVSTLASDELDPCVRKDDGNRKKIGYSLASDLGLDRFIKKSDKVSNSSSLRRRGSSEIKIKDSLQLNLKDSKACPHYVGRIIKNINPHAKTPIQITEKLRRSGIRSIHPIVDITNYVMLELGQPMHAFDLSKFEGNINVRMAKQDEKLTLLDGTEATLDTDSLVIADDKKALALAGIMGGLDSGVTLETQDLFLESAYFDPVQINKTSQRHNIQSDSSYRFARGVDFSHQNQALERMTELVLQIAGGEAGPVIEAIDKKFLPELPEIELRSKRITRIIGTEIPDELVENYLTALGMQFNKTKEGYTATPPAHRFDIRQEIDLVEEVARLYGYDNIPASIPTGQLSANPSDVNQSSVDDIRLYLVDNGYHEVVTYSFVDRKLATALSVSRNFRELVNPISSDLSTMRENHWPGLIQTYLHNYARQEIRQRLFETGMCFVQTKDSLVQKRRLGGLLTGTVLPESWSHESKNVDFYDIKGDIEALLHLSPREGEITFDSTEHPALHPGVSAEIKINNESAGFIGLLHPQWRQKFSIKSEIYLFDLDLDIIIKTLLPQYQAASKYPASRRDIAVVVDQDVPVAKLVKDINKNGGDALQDTQIFDVYVGKSVEAGKKSIAIGLTFNDPARTLVDDEVNTLMDTIISSLKSQFDATLRT